MKKDYKSQYSKIESLEYHRGKVKAINEIKNKLEKEYQENLGRRTRGKNIIASRIANQMKSKYLKGLLLHIEGKLQRIYKNYDRRI